MKDKKLIIMLSVTIILGIANIAFYSYIRITNLKEINKEEKKNYKETENAELTESESVKLDKVAAIYSEYYSLRVKYEAAAALKKQEEEVNNLSNINELKDLIKIIHGRLDDDVCYGETPSDDEYRFLSRCSDVFKNRTNNIKNNEDLRADIDDIASYLKDGGDKNDRNKIILAHRMCHDLDYYYFNNRSNANLFCLPRSIKVNPIGNR